MKLDPGKALDVFLHWGPGDQQPVGRLAYRNKVAYLEYDPGFVQAGIELSPVHHQTSAGLQRPYAADVFAGLHGVFNDSLPDGWGRMLVDRRARQMGIEPASLTPLDRLACVGRTAIGALCYAPASTIWGPGKKVLDLDQLAVDTRLVLEGDAGEVISILGQLGGSPAGARPKALIALNDAGHVVSSAEDAAAGYHHYLLKFPGQGDPKDIAAIEMAYAMMAQQAGVMMSETRLLEGTKGSRYFAARRFDRQGANRVHVHSASGLLYTDPRVPALDYQDLIALTRLVTRDQRECKAMYVLAVFNVLSHNRDDHARQFSFAMSRDSTWRLAPAYDLTCSQGPGGEHSTSVLGHGEDITRSQLIKLGKQADLQPADIELIIERVEAAIGQWKRFADLNCVSSKSAAEVAAALAQVRL